MHPRHRVTCLALLALLVAAPAGEARTPSHKKAIWGPVEVNGKSQFPTYRDLGVGIYQTGVSWDAIAPTRPANPTDPDDPAYRWPSEIDQALSEGRKYGIQVSVTLR